MRILTVDVGTGTQDILLFDGENTIENGAKMVVPSPTTIFAAQIREATAQGESILLTGVTAGGGPCAWAASEHLGRGLTIYATPDAARTFDDDLNAVAQMGVRVVSEDEARALRVERRIQLRDFDYDSIAAAFGRFGVEMALDAIAVAVFDHGAAPPDVSDRLFRFEYIAETVKGKNDLTAFAYLAGEVPPIMTRMRAVEKSVPSGLPLLLMDTAPAAVLGALEDPAVGSLASALVVNIGNSHTLAFHLVDGRIAGLFEHHTGFLSREKLEGYLRKLGDGSISHDEVFQDRGHGAMIVSKPQTFPVGLAVTGPRRKLIRGSRLNPHFAVPHGDMMIAGCFGLLRAFAAKDARVAEAVIPTLAGAS